MDITTEPKNHLSFASLKEKNPKDSANIHFGASMYNMYLRVSRFVVKKMIPFATTWICEAGFIVLCAY